MAYGSNITQSIPVTIGNSVSNSYLGSDYAYDVALSGLPFILGISDTNPYQRVTAQYRKNQVDQSTEPGEQTLTGWWLRSQVSFHSGSGIKFYEPTGADDAAHYRFNESKGVNIWTKGQATLLKSCVQGHNTTGPIATNLRSQQQLRSIKWSGTDGVLLHDEYDVDKIDGSGTVTHFIDYNSGVDFPVYGICDDGTTAYWVTNKTSTGKITMYKKVLTGDYLTADTQMWTHGTDVVTNCVMEYVKERIIACINNSIYEYSKVSTAVGTAIYTHPNTDYVFTSITASGAAIYAAGYNGLQSTILKMTLTSGGAMPSLSGNAATAAEMPVGEIIHKIYYYLGYMLIGTSKGIRVATVNDQDGSISYGPLIVESSQPCYDFAARDHFVWCATSVAGEAGVVRIDLGAEIEPLRFAWANDIYYDAATGHPTTTCAFIGDTSRLAFATAYAGATVGYTYIEDSATYRTTGYIKTGNIRYGTLEPKLFKLLRPRGSTVNGGLSMQSVDSNGTEYSIGSYDLGTPLDEVGIPYPIGSKEYLSFIFTLTGPGTSTPTFEGYQIKSLPATPRQRIIQYPVFCYDSERDKNGNQIGYEGSSYDRLLALEEIESNGDIILVQDFRTGESYQAQIEQLNFVNQSPPSDRFSGFGGILEIQVRKI